MLTQFCPLWASDVWLRRYAREGGGHIWTAKSCDLVQQVSTRPKNKLLVQTNRWELAQGVAAWCWNGSGILVVDVEGIKSERDIQEIRKVIGGWWRTGGDRVRCCRGDVEQLSGDVSRYIRQVPVYSGASLPGYQALEKLEKEKKILEAALKAKEEDEAVFVEEQQVGRFAGEQKRQKCFEE